MALERKQEKIQAFEDAVYEKAVNEPVNYLKPKLELNCANWQEFLMDHCDNSEIIELKKELNSTILMGLGKA